MAHHLRTLKRSEARAPDGSVAVRRLTSNCSAPPTEGLWDGRRFGVPQIFNLLCRRFPIGQASDAKQDGMIGLSVGRLETCVPSGKSHASFQGDTAR
ncbi:MAG: hypothetical protein ACYDH9_22110 [Limisphaerales bacterium]